MFLDYMYFRLCWISTDIFLSLHVLSSALVISLFFVNDFHAPKVINTLDYLRVRRSQKLLLVLKFTCTNKNGNFVKETDTSGYIVV